MVARCIPEFHGVFWKLGQMIDIGTLGSGTASLGSNDAEINASGSIVCRNAPRSCDSEVNGMHNAAAAF